jgi:glycosyltransferase involved in cell wall biosynthesis
MIAPLCFSLSAKFIRYSYNIDLVHGNGYTIGDDVTTMHFLRKGFRYRASNLGYKIPQSKEELFEEVVIKSAKHIIAPSKIMEEDLVKLCGVDRRKISIVYNGVDVTRFKAPSAEEKHEIRSKLGLCNNAIYVGFVGPARWKGFSWLMFSLSKLPNDIRLVAVNINENEREEYVALAKKLGVDNRVLLLPLLKDISSFYKAIDLFVLPSVYDVFP